MCLSRWDEFEESYQQFSSWLREAEVQLRAETEHKATVEEKKLHWDEYQVCGGEYTLVHRLHKHTYAHRHTCMHVRAHTRAHAYMHTLACTRARTCTHTPC